MTLSLLLGRLMMPVVQAAQSAWVSFRGEGGSGSTPEQVLSEGRTNLTSRWSVTIPGSGHASPVVSDGTVYVSTAYPATTGRIAYLTAYWLATLAVVTSAWLALLRGASGGLPGGHVFNLAWQIAVLFLLVTAGRELLGCQNDGFRSTILAVVTVSAALLLAQTMTVGWMAGQRIVALIGLLATGVALYYVLQLPVLRGPKIMVSAALLPLFPAGLALAGGRTTSPGSSLWRGLAPWLLPLVLLSVVVSVSHGSRNANFWTIQPTTALRVPIWYVTATAAIGLAGLAVCRAGLTRPRVRVVGLVWLGWALVLAIPIGAAPVVNSFQYSKYQLVRGHVGSALGWPGWLASGALLALASLAPILPSRFGRRLVGSTPCSVLLVVLALMAGLLPLCGSLVGSAGGLVSALMAVKADTGTVRWIQEGLQGPARGAVNSYNSSATPTPVIVGDLVVAYFGERGAFGCHRETGELRWAYEDLPYRSQYGPASSPVALESAIVIQSDSEEIESYVIALSRENGRPVWKHRRHGHPTWRSPVVLKWQGREVICTMGSNSCDLLDSATGSLLRSVKGFDFGIGDPVASPVLGVGELFLAGDERLYVLPLRELFEGAATEFRIETPSARGAKSDDELPRIKPRLCVGLDGDGPTCSTPAFDRGRVFCVSDSGTLFCLSAEDGRRLCRAEVGPVRSSPVVAGGILYLATDAGLIKALAVSDTALTEIASVDLSEPITASPAVAEGALFIRTRSRLHCLGVAGAQSL